MNLAVIPARGGSKRIPRKNIRPFFGKPVIGWAIEAAIASQCFDRILVSTDDEEIAGIAKQFGAEVPFCRPIELADDHATTVAVVAHAVAWQARYGTEPKSVCCIYPTSVFLRSEPLHEGMRLLESGTCDYAISVTKYASPIQRALSIAPDGRIKMLQPEFANTRSQDLSTTYHDAGQFYWGHANSWLSERPLLSSSSLPVFLPHYLAQDIDTIEDWIHAEMKFTHYHAANA